MMKEINKLIDSYKPLSHILIVAFTIIIIGSLLKGYIYSFTQLFFIPFFGSVITQTSALFLKLVGYNIDAHGNVLFLASSALNKLRIGIGYLSLYHFSFVVIGILFLKVTIKRKIFYILGAIVFFFLFNSLRATCVVISLESFGFTSVRPVREFFQLILNSFVLFLAIQWLAQFYTLKKLLLGKFDIAKQTLRMFIQRFAITLLVVFIVKFIINADLLPFGDYMAYSILWFTKAFLLKLGYITDIIGFRHIKGNVAGVILADPCLGVNLIIAFAGFIAIITGKWFHKVWFIASGVMGIYFLNVLRMSLLYIYLANNNGKYATFLEIHDLYNYTIYILTFVLWVVWINKFSKM